ncbi:MAG: MFS transporter, partial [Vulcanococcus sp.]
MGHHREPVHPAPKPIHPVSEAPRPTGLQGVLALPEFRKLWLGQIFSQLADKFYIVLMVFLIAQYWVTET